MDENEQVYPSGQHYSARHKVPNIKQFMDSLDRDKKKRDANIDHHPQEFGGANGEAKDHIPTQKPGKNRRTVRDPVTGKDVEIEDIDSKHMKAAKDPVVCGHSVYLHGFLMTVTMKSFQSSEILTHNPLAHCP